MTVIEMRKELNKRGYKFAELVKLNKVQLQELMNHDNGMQKEEEVETPEEDAGEVDVTVSDEKKVDIYKGESLIRTYSEKVHGEDYYDLAEQFIQGHKGFEMR